MDLDSNDGPSVFSSRSTTALARSASDATMDDDIAAEALASFAAGAEGGGARGGATRSSNSKAEFQSRDGDPTTPSARSAAAEPGSFRNAGTTRTRRVAGARRVTGARPPVPATATRASPASVSPGLLSLGRSPLAAPFDFDRRARELAAPGKTPPAERRDALAAPEPRRSPEPFALSSSEPAAPGKTPPAERRRTPAPEPRGRRSRSRSAHRWRRPSSTCAAPRRCPPRTARSRRRRWTQARVGTKGRRDAFGGGGRRRRGCNSKREASPRAFRRGALPSARGDPASGLRGGGYRGGHQQLAARRAGSRSATRWTPRWLPLSTASPRSGTRSTPRRMFCTSWSAPPTRARSRWHAQRLRPRPEAAALAVVTHARLSGVVLEEVSSVASHAAWALRELSRSAPRHQRGGGVGGRGGGEAAAAAVVEKTGDAVEAAAARRPRDGRRLRRCGGGSGARRLRRRVGRAAPRRVLAVGEARPRGRATRRRRRRRSRTARTRRLCGRRRRPGSRSACAAPRAASEAQTRCTRAPYTTWWSLPVHRRVRGGGPRGRGGDSGSPRGAVTKNRDSSRADASAEDVSADDEEEAFWGRGAPDSRAERGGAEAGSGSGWESGLSPGTWRVRPKY